MLYGTTIIGEGDCVYGNVFKVNIDGTGLATIKGFTKMVVHQEDSLAFRRSGFGGRKCGHGV
jgi:hypothetical protein